MTNSHQPPGPGSRVALHLRVRRRRTRRRPPRRARPLAPAAGGGALAGSPGPAPAGTVRAAASALAEALRRQLAARPWGLAGFLALAVAFGLGRLSKTPEPSPSPPDPAPTTSAEAPRPGDEPAFQPPARQPERREDPTVFLEHPPAVALPEPGEHEVLCIRKPERSARKSIEQIGGRRRDGAPWRLARDQAIAGIQADRWSFHVGSGDAASEVLVDVSRSGNEYLTTRPDGRADNNLLSLPECP